jgi:trans-aconitate methyltransferase
MPRPARELARSFIHLGVATAYRHRPPYPDEVFELLAQLIVDEPRRVLDLGAGEGALARPLAALVDEVDAVDPSAAMIEVGRGRRGGDAPNLHWVQATAETCPLRAPYALVVAGASFHWFDWPVTLTRLAGVLAEHAVLAIAGYELCAVPWQAQLDELIPRYSRSPDFDSQFRLIEALQATGHYTLLGERVIAPHSFSQRVTDYIESFHSTSALARELMTGEEAARFDCELGEIVSPHARDGMLDLRVEAIVHWGRPR